MEDEDGYMTLSPQPSNKSSAPWAEARMMQGNSKLIARYKILLRILGATCVILGLAVIVLIVFAQASEGGLCKGEAEAGSFLKDPKRADGSPCSKRMAIHLCEPFTESASCKLCPNNWIAQKEKCYWFSKEKWEWLRGYSDCSKKRSQMLVVQDWAEMEFIQDFTQEKYPVWIGLNVTSLSRTWTWVQGSALNQTLFPLPLPGTEVGCGVVKSGQIRSEMCTAEFRWICEKEALVF